MPDQALDRQFMQRALDLARQGIGLTSPNPCVGAVIVDADGKIVGTGTHTYDGVKHAEILALEQAGERAHGGTLYINLEPCSYYGRTPPCADTLTAAGIARVVASMGDPNPAVSGRGFEKLRGANICVEIGLLANEARRLNEAFAKYIRLRLPFVTLKSAMTLNARIAPAQSSSETASWDCKTSGPRHGWITGEAAHAHVHQLRHQHDAILVGIGTLLADNPLLTDRSGLSRRRPPLRLVLDSRLRMPLNSKLARSAKDGTVFLFYGQPFVQELKEKRKQVEDLGIRAEPVRLDPEGRLNLHQILRRLGELQITSLMIEGGSAVNGAALAAGIVDKLSLYYAPKLFTTAESVPFATPPDSSLIEPTQLKFPSLHQFDDDFAIEGYLRDPYGD